MRKISLKTKGLTDVVEITEKVQEILDEQNDKQGIVNIFGVGSTVAITTIEADPNLYKDLQEALEQFSPVKKNWRHNETWTEGDDNGSSHIRSSMFGTSLTVPFENKKLYLGTWQKIVLIDFDTRPRLREVIVSIIDTK